MYVYVKKNQEKKENCACVRERAFLCFVLWALIFLFFRASGAQELGLDLFVQVYQCMRSNQDSSGALPVSLSRSLALSFSLSSHALAISRSRPLSSCLPLSLSPSLSPTLPRSEALLECALFATLIFFL